MLRSPVCVIVSSLGPSGIINYDAPQFFVQQEQRSAAKPVFISSILGNLTSGPVAAYECAESPY